MQMANCHTNGTSFTPPCLTTRLWFPISQRCSHCVRRIIIICYSISRRTTTFEGGWNRDKASWKAFPRFFSNRLVSKLCSLEPKLKQHGGNDGSREIMKNPLIKIWRHVGIHPLYEYFMSNTQIIKHGERATTLISRQTFPRSGMLDNWKFPQWISSSRWNDSKPVKRIPFLTSPLLGTFRVLSHVCRNENLWEIFFFAFKWFQETR